MSSIKVVGKYKWDKFPIPRGSGSFFRKDIVLPLTSILLDGSVAIWERDQTSNLSVDEYLQIIYLCLLLLLSLWKQQARETGIWEISFLLHLPLEFIWLAKNLVDGSVPPVSLSRDSCANSRSCLGFRVDAAYAKEQDRTSPLSARVYCVYRSTYLRRTRKPCASFSLINSKLPCELSLNKQQQTTNNISRP